MAIIDPVIVNLAVGIGLLIGAERERRKARGRHAHLQEFARSP
jgi:hypothetical protein